MVKKSDINSKLDKILENQKEILENEAKILGEEKKLEELERKDLEGDKITIRTEEEALRELEKIGKNIKSKVSSPLRKITSRDLLKGFIGSFIAMLGHFAFAKASDLAVNLDPFRIFILYFVAFVMIIVMLYYAGFRNVHKTVIMKFLPFRAVVLYCVSIFTVIFVNLLFNKIHFPFDFMEIYSVVGASIMLAVMGAGTADLIGRNE